MAELYPFHNDNQISPSNFDLKGYGAGAQGHSVAARGVAALGKNTKSAATNHVYTDLESYQYAKKRKKRFKMKDLAGRALGGRVASCMRVRAVGRGGESVQPGISRNESGNCHFHGAGVCGSVWSCPVCAVKVMETRRREVLKAMQVNRQQNGVALLVTFTLSHTADQGLKEVLTGLLDNLRRFKALRRVKQSRSSIGYYGQIRALEVRHSLNSGWHPHCHEIWFLESTPDKDTLKQVTHDLKTEWVKCLNRKGIKASYDHGLDVKFKELEGSEAAGSYIAKWGYELAYSTTKKGKTGSRCPWEILESLTDKWNLLDFRLFQEYSEVFKGRSQLYWSRGLKDRFGIDDIDDLAIADSPEKEVIYSFTDQEWRTVSKFKLHSDVLSIAETQPHKITAFIEQFFALERDQSKRKRELYQKIERATFDWMKTNGISC
jgi:hypothetical protein